jgi:hypothetical protein
VAFESALGLSMAAGSSDTLLIRFELGGASSRSSAGAPARQE